MYDHLKYVVASMLKVMVRACVMFGKSSVLPEETECISENATDESSCVFHCLEQYVWTSICTFLIVT